MTTATFDLQQTVRSAQAGDRNAFSDLVTRYKNLVFSAALSVVRDADAAGDITQNVFLSAWQRLSAIRSPSSFPPWLRETARRQALYHLRSRSRARRREQLPEPDTIAPAEAGLIEREDSQALEAALDQVPADVRELLLLYYSENHSVAQVADLLELSEDAVKKRLQRARDCVRTEIDQALQARTKRLLPGVALVAAILAALDRPANALPPPRSGTAARLAAAGLVVALAAAVLLGVAWRAGRPPGLRASAAVAASAGAASPIARSALAVQHAVAAAAAPLAATTTPSAGVNTTAGFESCRLNMDALMRSTLEIEEGDLPELRAAVAKDPDQVALHALTAMALWFSDVRPAAADPRATTLASLFLPSEWATHALWLVERCAGSELFKSNAALYPKVTEDPVGATLAAAWARQLARYPKDARVHANAAELFTLSDWARAEQLLLRAAQLEPDNREWSLRLGHLHSLSAHKGAGGVESAQNAVGYFEQARSSDPRDPRAIEETATAALHAGDVGLANERAQELLALAPRLQGWRRANAVHHAHIVLGQIALGEGHLDEAEGHLAAAANVAGSPQLNSFGPDFTLAKSMLESGRRDAVLGYLDRVGRFWKAPACLGDWGRAIRAGERPAFTKWECDVSDEAETR